jgi:hypothetical protein
MSNKNRKLRKVNMLDERFNSLRESINTTKGSEELFWVKWSGDDIFDLMWLIMKRIGI